VRRLLWLLAAFLLGGVSLPAAIFSSGCHEAVRKATIQSLRRFASVVPSVQADLPCGPTRRSTGPTTACHLRASFHSGPSAPCRRGPVSSDVMPQAKIHKTALGLLASTLAASDLARNRPKSSWPFAGSGSFVSSIAVALISSVADHGSCAVLALATWPVAVVALLAPLTPRHASSAQALCLRASLGITGRSSGQATAGIACRLRVKLVPPLLATYLQR